MGFEHHLSLTRKIQKQRFVVLADKETRCHDLVKEKARALFVPSALDPVILRSLHVDRMIHQYTSFSEIFHDRQKFQKSCHGQAMRLY